MRTLSRFIVSSALALAAFVVQAQDTTPIVEVEPAADPGIALGIDSGSVLVSTGGEFTQAAPGQVLAAGDRVLVSEGSSATLSYSGGCQKALATAGVYTVEADCSLPGTRSGGPSAGVIAGVVGGVAVIAAAAGGGGGGGGGGTSPPVPPISP
ncbi:hypothetical protein [Luteimonas sp. A649]